MGVLGHHIAEASDRLVSIFSPVAGARRAAARASLRLVNSLGQGGNPSLGYGRHGASRLKRSILGWLAKPGDADADIGRHLEGSTGLRARSRDLWMGTPIARSSLSTLRLSTVGPGLRLSPQINAEFLGLTEEEADAWERQVRWEFSLWADSTFCDAARKLTFGGLQALAFLSAGMSGDVFAVLPVVPRKGSVYDLRVQLLEADRVCNPWPQQPERDIEGGVEIGEHGEAVAYHIADKHPAADTIDAHRVKTRRVEAWGTSSGRRQVLHVMPVERPDQRRGVPAFAPVMEALKQLGRYTQAEIDAAVLTAMLTVFVTTENADVKEIIGEADDGTGTTDENDDDLTKAEQEASDAAGFKLGSGNIIGLAPGEKVETVNPNRPNTAFDAFVRSVCVQVGAALDVPSEIVLKHFGKSYTASRAAFVEFWKTVVDRRAWFSAQFCQPIYEEWLAEAVARGRVHAPGFFADPAIRAAWSRALWNGPAQGQINERVEVGAAHDRVRYGFSTMEQETAQLSGRDWHETHRTRARELVKQREAGTAAPYESTRGQKSAAQGA